MKSFMIFIIVLCAHHPIHAMNPNQKKPASPLSVSPEPESPCTVNSFTSTVSPDHSPSAVAQVPLSKAALAQAFSNVQKPESHDDEDPLWNVSPATKTPHLSPKEGRIHIEKQCIRRAQSMPEISSRQ